jgi:sec-independent protein translocase protein TatA
MSPLFALFDIPTSYLVILGVLAVLLYGERLPEVARSFGKGFMEFKRGMSGLQNELRNAIDTVASPPDQNSSSSSGAHNPPASESDVHQEATAPKFEPPT